MIWIHNTGGDLEGICRYEVLVNRDLICSFEHDRKDGLAVCLLRAAIAVKEADDDRA